MSTTIDTEIADVLAKLTARVAVGDAAAAPQVDLEAERLASRRERRVRAMVALGWERRPLHLVRDAAYDEARAAGYLAALRAIDERPEAGIVVLAGNPGSGKTTAACRWALTRQAEAPRFLRAAEFFRSSRYQRGDDGDKALTRDEILRSKALVLDDAGAEYADPHGNYRVDLDELVDRFYADHRALVITTNLVYATPRQRDAAKARGEAVDADAPTFACRYGERVTDRIRECGRWVSSHAASQRRSPTP